jgi:hypothetical protein
MLMGLGNGAVFKLVPEHFPKDTGTVTGLVGALADSEASSPPLLLGVFRDQLGVIWPGFLLAVRHRAPATRRQPARLSARATSRGRSPFRSPRARRSSESERGAWAALVTATLAAAIVVGSRTLQHFDAALVGYTFATLFAGLRHQLPVRHVAAASADPHVLAPRVAGVLLPAARWPATRLVWDGGRFWNSPPTLTSFAAAGFAASRTG